MSTRVPVKSILKHQNQVPQQTQQDKSEKDRQNLQLALHHANLLQHRKAIELKIVKAIEILLDFPSSTLFTPAEAARFIGLIQFFQPSDYDNLVEERRIDDRCGYALCSKAPRRSTLGVAAEWKVGKGAADYCSSACARKSLYIRTQLSSVPAWERSDGFRIDVVLHPDDQPQEIVSVVAVRQSTGNVVSVANDHELALERGESATSLRPRQVMTDVVVERATFNQQHRPAAVEEASVSHTAIEGYEPKAKLNRRALETSELNHNADSDGEDVEEDEEDDDDDDDG